MTSTYYLQSFLPKPRQPSHAIAFSNSFIVHFKEQKDYSLYCIAYTAGNFLSMYDMDHS